MNQWLEATITRGLLKPPLSVDDRLLQHALLYHVTLATMTLIAAETTPSAWSSFYHCAFMWVSTLANSLVLFINEDTSYQSTPRELALSFYCFKSSVGWVQSIEVFLHTRCCYDVSVESEMFSINIEHQMHRKCVLIVWRGSRIFTPIKPMHEQLKLNSLSLEMKVVVLVIVELSSYIALCLIVAVIFWSALMCHPADIVAECLCSGLVFCN